MEQYTLEFFTRVGVFEIGSNIHEYTKSNIDYDYRYMSDIATECYSFNSLYLRVSCENDLITAITCDRYCFYKGHNLIGMTIHQCKKILSAIPTTHEYLWISDTERQSVYTFDCLGLMLWFSKRRLVTVICMRYIEDD